MELASRTVLGFSGALLSMVGLVLAAGGLMSPFEGSAFFAFAGVGLALSGALIAKRNRAGAYTYLSVFALTVSWALRNVDHGPSLGERLIGPVVLLAMLAALMPVLCRWQPRMAAAAFAVVGLATIGLGVASSNGGPLAHRTAAVTQFLDSAAKGALQ